LIYGIPTLRLPIENRDQIHGQKCFVFPNFNTIEESY